MKEQNLPEEQVKAIESLFATDTNTYVQKVEKKKEKKKVYIKASHLQEFQTLWNAINKNAFYVLETLTAEQESQLIQNIKSQIENLDIQEILLETKRAELNVSKLDQQDAITTKSMGSISYKSKIDYLELVTTLSNNTKTPISFVVKVFNALSDNFKSIMLRNNPAQAQREISEIMKMIFFFSPGQNQ